MINLGEIAELMRDHNRAVAPGSECTSWGDFVNDCYASLGCGPWDGYAETAVTTEFAEYWSEVAAGASPDYPEEAGD